MLNLFGSRFEIVDQGQRHICVPPTSAEPIHHPPENGSHDNVCLELLRRNLLKNNIEQILNNRIVSFFFLILFF